MRGRPPRHLADLSLAERRAAVAAAGLPEYRADQLSTHWFARLADDPRDWTDIPAALRAPLAESLCPPLLARVRDITCDGGMTVKTLWQLHEGARVESVLMRYPATRRSRERITVCVSSQAGCGMNCPFCATGQAGLTRNLSTAEIVEQVLAGARDLARGAVAGGTGRVSNVVFMGMGEPLANYSAVLEAVRRLTEPPPAGLGMSARGVTVSTVGLVPAMRRLAGEGIPVTLALSLHAPDDELRDTLVPVNTRWKVGEALDAAYGYAQATGPGGSSSSASAPSAVPVVLPTASGRPPCRSIRAAATTCSTISAADRLRVRPSWPVAQNGQFMPHPAWLEMHTVTRCG